MPPGDPAPKCRVIFVTDLPARIDSPGKQGLLRTREVYQQCLSNGPGNQFSIQSNLQAKY